MVQYRRTVHMCDVCQRVSQLSPPPSRLHRIDVVYSWSDDSAPGFRDAWQRRVDQWVAKGGPPQRARPERWRSHDELRFSIRSLRKHLKQLGRIFILTGPGDSVSPAWLGSAHPNLTVVPHSAIFKPELQAAGALPTFCSRSIETMLHRVPGVSSPFLYLNDDFFFATDTSPSDFARGEQTVLFGSQHVTHLDYSSFIAHHLPARALDRFWRAEKGDILARRATTPARARPHKASEYEASVAKSGMLVRRRLREADGCATFGAAPWETRYLSHVPYLVHGGVLRLLWEIWADELRQLALSPFRDVGFVSLLHLHAYLLVACGRAAFEPTRTGEPRSGAWYMVASDAPRERALLERVVRGDGPPRFFVLQDGPQSADWARIGGALRQLYPRASEWEATPPAPLPAFRFGGGGGGGGRGGGRGGGFLGGGPAPSRRGRGRASRRAPDSTSWLRTTGRGGGRTAATRGACVGRGCPRSLTQAGRPAAKATTTAAAAAPPWSGEVDTTRRAGDYAGDYCSAVRRSHRWTPRCNNTRLRPAGPRADAPTAACLVTGVGRSGTMHTSSVLSGLGWNVDHDRRSSPLCPCPGDDGSASHMYSFRRHPRCVYASSPQLTHLFRRVVHQTRHPLAYINSRVRGGSLQFFCRVNLLRPSLTAPMMGAAGRAAVAKLALHKWVLQNTYVGTFADWQFAVEAATTNASKWVELAHRCGLRERLRRGRGGATAGVPSAAEFGRVATALGAQTNHEHVDKEGRGRKRGALAEMAPSNWTWPALLKLDRPFALAAMHLASQYGYDDVPQPQPRPHLRCGFVAHNGESPWACDVRLSELI